MISSVATAAAVEHLAQERRRQQQLLAGEENKEVVRTTSSETSALDAEEHAEGQSLQQTLDKLDAQTHPSAGIPDVLAAFPADGHGNALEGLEPPNRAPGTPKVSQPNAQLLTPRAEPEPAPEPATKPRPQPPKGPGGPPHGSAPTPAAAPAATSASAAAPVHPVARLVDIVLHLTNDRYGASVRVQRKLAEEVVQGVAEAADESERGDSVTLSLAQSTRASGLGSAAATSTSLADLMPGSSKFATEVEDVYKFDLMEGNPNWRNFLTSQTVIKVQKWEARRQAAHGCVGRCVWSRTRMWIYMTLSYPDFSRLAYWLGVFLIAIIFLNTATFCIESVPRYAHTPVYNALMIVDYVCMCFFTFEYVARLLCCPNLWHFARSFSNFIDLVAILPFYVELIVRGTSTESEAFQTRIVRLLRVFRVLRIVKTMPKLRHLTLVADTLRDSLEVLIMLAFLLLVLLVVFGTVIFFVEPSTFDSIPQAMYYAQTTLTTTGYGDVYPVTPWGRFVAGVAMLLCMVVVSLPIAVIGGNFSERWSDYKSFKTAVDRSGRVYPTTKLLRVELEKYEKTLDDVILRLQETEVAQEKQLQAVRLQLANARSVLLAAAAGGGVAEPPGGAAAGAGAGGAGRWTGVAKGLLRRHQNGSTGSVTATKVSQHGVAAPEPPRGSSNNLVDMAEASVNSGLDPAAGPGLEPGAGGSPKRLKDLRSAAALGARTVAQPAQLSEGGPEATAAASTTDPAEGPEGPHEATRGAALKKVMQRFIKEHARRDSTREAAAPSSTDPSAHARGDGSGSGNGATAGGPPHPMGGQEPVVSMELAAAPEEVAGSPGPAAQPEAAGSQRSMPGPAEERVASPPASSPPPPPPGPAPPPPPAPHPPQSHPLFLQPSVGAESTGGLISPMPSLPLASSISVGRGRNITASLASLLGRKSDAATAAAAAAAASVDEAAATLPMDPAALQTASGVLDQAHACCSRARDLRIRHEALAAQAQILRTDDMPFKFEKLDESYRILRCWQDELGPLAERMWTLRDALDELAWALQEGLPEADLKYQPPSPEGRRQKDLELGVDRRTATTTEAGPGPGTAKAGAGDWEGGSARAGFSGLPGGNGTVHAGTAFPRAGGATATVPAATVPSGVPGAGPDGTPPVADMKPS